MTYYQFWIAYNKITIQVRKRINKKEDPFMKKLLSILLASLMIVGMVSVASAEDVEVTLFNNKAEIETTLQVFAEQYSAATEGVTVTVETAGGGVDYQSVLKSKNAADQLPVIFVIEGKGNYELWQDYIADMSDCAWVADTDLAYMSPDGAAVGFPVSIEGYGLGYNADILAAAEIDPATLTTFSAVKAAFEKLDGMKDELGLDSVVSCGTNSGELWWVTAQHVFNAYYAGYLDYNDTTVIDNALLGVFDEERLQAFATYLKLLYDYSDPDILISGNYDAQVGAFANGKAAFITQGNWIDPNMSELGADFPMGYISHCYLEEPTQGLYMSVPSWYVVNSAATAEQQAAAEAFLDYLALSDAGAEYMVTESSMVPAFKSVSVQPAGQFSKALVEASARGGNYNWFFGMTPDGFNSDTLGPIFELFASEGDVDAFMADIEDAFASITK